MPLEQYGSLIGVRRRLALSKRDLLLFDGVVVLGLGDQLSAAFHERPEVVADAEYLAEQGFLAPGTQNLHELADVVSNLIDPRDLKAYDNPEGPFGVPHTVQERVRLASTGRHPSSLYGDDPVLVGRAGGEVLTAYAMSPAWKAIPILNERLRASDWDFWRRAVHVPADVDGQSAARLVEVVVAALPVPGEGVPLEDVLEFCRDSGTLALRDRLMRAMAGADIEKRSPESFRLQLEEAIEDYRAHVQIAKLRERSAGMTILLSVTGAVEELVRLRPRRAIESLVQFKAIKADRLEAELSAPGREFAYIDEADRTFGR